MGKFEAQQAFDHSNRQPASMKPGVAEICSMWHHSPGSAPSKVVTPNSVLDAVHVDSPPLENFECLLSHSAYMCDGDCDKEGHDFDMADYMQDSHDPDTYPILSPPLCSTHFPLIRSPWEGGTSILEDNVPMVAELPVDEAIQSPGDSGNSEECGMLIFDHHESQHLGSACLIDQKELAEAPPRGVSALLRQHVKNYLDRVLHEELALCGCKHMVGQDEGRGTPEDHCLECKMRTDYAMWVMWMQERSIRNEGLDLVRRLLACAEAVACRDARQAQALLQSVQELASPYGDSLQRVAFCFMEGLAARLFQHHVAGSTPTNQSFPTFENGGGINNFSSQSRMIAHGNASEEGLGRQQEAFRLMCEVCPYVPFGHFVANSVILEAVEGEERVHVIDLGVTEGPQWPALIRRLATRPGGPPKLLRITGVGTFGSQPQRIGKILQQEAAAASLNLEFKAIHQPLENIAEAELGLRDGETVVVNSILRLHCVVKESRGSLNTVLHAIHGLSPKVLTLVEQDANHNGPFFLGRFMEALHYYSAIFDSLQTALPRSSTRRVNIEQCHLAREIGNIVASEGPARVERHERVDQWRRRMSRAGFQLAPIRLEGQARAWLATNYAAHVDDFTLADEKGCLVLGWKGKPIIAASAWRC